MKILDGKIMEEEIDILEPKSQLTWCDWATQGLKTPKVQWRRLNHKGHRFYFAKDGENLMIGAGITTVISESYGESRFLREWKDSRPNWKEDLRLMADYGTLLHISFAEILKDGKVSQEVIKLADSKFNKKTQFKKDCLAIIKFFNDYNVKPIFIEGILGKEYISKNGKKSYVCSAIDLFCKLTITNKRKELVDDGVYLRGENKGQPKPQKEVIIKEEEEVYAICDLKSNYDDKESKSFFDSHKMQLIFGSELIKDNFNVDNVRMFNISPLNYKLEPKFVLTEHKNDTNYYGYTDLELLNNRINTGIIEGTLQPKGQIFQISDEITLDTKLEVLSYEELAERTLNELL